jgi:hypothetical protein
MNQLWVKLLILNTNSLEIVLFVKILTINNKFMGTNVRVVKEVEE